MFSKKGVCYKIKDNNTISAKQKVQNYKTNIHHSMCDREKSNPNDINQL